jgi:hypothetical protein
LVLIMSIHSRFIGGLSIALLATRVAAQSGDGCPVGWGTALGITGLQCPSCAFRRDTSGRQNIEFFAEPVVLQTLASSAFAPGDIIEAVNGRPITTSAGAEQFVRPPSGTNEIAVRRGRDRRVLPVTISAASAECEQSVRVVASTARSSSAALIVVDGVIMQNAAGPPSDTDSPETGKFGFALACNAPSCKTATGTEGKTMFTYYKYDSYPPIIAVKPGSPAARVGLKVGDVVVKVDDISVLEDAGAQRLASARWKDDVRLTVARGSREVVTHLTKTP